MAENKVRKIVYVVKEDQDELARLADLNGFSISAMTSLAIRQGLDLMLNSNASIIRT
jgi:hypothetical protein